MSITSGVDDDSAINVQVFVPELGVQKCLCVGLDEIVWDIKHKVLSALNEPPPEAFNYGLFLPPCDGRAGKFLLEDRPIRDYPFHDCVPYLELKYKKRVYKMMKLDEKQLKQLHSKGNLKKFMETVTHRQADKVEKMCAQGLDPNFHDAQGETPLTMAAAVAGSSDVMVALVGGGAHLDFRNAEGQTPMHKAAFLASGDNVKTLLELGASPNYRDPIGLTPLYYCMLTADTSADAAELLLRDSADVGVTDMHGNHEIHQACKNGLTKHVEHLLYYGADADAMNVNGNTPLHVCAVNNRAECARVLLFRGADAGIVNKQGQTAFHVANIVGNQSVAEIIRTHNPTTSVPYRGAPRYNSKRRTSTTVARRRSFSQSSLCSQSSHNDQQSVYRSSAYGQSRCVSAAPSPSPSRVSIAFTETSTASRRPPPLTVDGRDYGTLPMRKFPPELVKTTSGGHEVNVPRILVIPRGPKGFGFILRGAKKMEPGVQFEPSPTVPALQFFEGVDMSGMAMKAGLRPGDFLLQINGVDVRRASHDQVVELIQQADDTITLKVITIDTSRFVAGTMPARRTRARSSLPPPPPARHPSTSLSTAKGGRFLTQSIFRFPDEQIYANGGARLVPAKSVETLPHSANYIDPSAIHVVERVASVKNRPNSRRISAAELEHLMIRQSSTISAESSSYDQDSLGPQTPKKFTSVADMKRRKNRMPPPSPQLPMGPGLPRVLYHDQQQQNRSMINSSPVRPPLKSFASSPDLNSNDYQHEQQRHVFVAPPPPPQSSMLRRGSADSSNEVGDYSRPFRPTSRPKTPPPPPPPPPTASTSNGHARQQQAQQQRTVPAAAPPPPPPPPPPEALRATAEPSRIPPPPPIHGMTNGSNAPKGDCRGVTADSLRGVQLKKTKAPVQHGPGRVVESQSTPAISAMNLSGVKLKPAMKRDESAPSSVNGGAGDFDSDLRNALAKRRTKVKCQESTDDEHKKVNFSLDGDNGDMFPSTMSTLTNGHGAAHQSRFGGLSLKESVRENVPAKPTKGKTQHSPPPVVNGFGNKKDSGYTSSRTSLEPSECGDETVYPTVLRVNDDSSPIAEAPDSPGFPAPPPPEFLNAAINCCTPDVASAATNRVSILSQQLEDSFGGQPPPALPKKPVGLKRELSRSSQKPSTIREHDAVSVTSTLSTLSGCSEGASSGGRPDSSQAAVPRVPPPDYDAADSGTGDSDNDDITPTISRIDLSCRSGGNEFVNKELSSWSPGDVCDWLDSLQLGEYKQRFLDGHITGRQLIVCDRARFTSLGVTRIAHRKLIEHSLKCIASPPAD